MTERFVSTGRRIREWAAKQAGVPVEQTQFTDYARAVSIIGGRVIARKIYGTQLDDASWPADWTPVNCGDNATEFVE